MPLAEPPERLLHDAIVGEVLPTDRILRLRNTEQDDAGEAERDDVIHPAVEDVINGEVVDTGHRGDLPLDTGYREPRKGVGSGRLRRGDVP